MQLCYLRFPGIVLGVDETPFPALLKLAADQLGMSVDSWSDYGRREQTRREHLVELQKWLRLSAFGLAEHRRSVYQLTELAQQSDRGIVLAEALVEMLRQQRIILPAIDVIERICSEALTLGTRRVYEALTEALSDHHRGALDGLLEIREGTKGSGLIWLRQPPGPPKPKHILAHLERLKIIRELSSSTSKSGAAAEDKHLLLTAVLADAINLGLSKMAESCPGTTYAKLVWLQASHIRDETYSAGLAELVNAQFRQPFAAYWGDGTTSSSDGQNFKAGGRGQFAGQVNLKYGREPGIQFYTHISDQYAPFHTKVINATVRDATHVLDGLLYHESDLRIEEHYTDTTGFTDHVFALMHLLGFRFAPRIRDLVDNRLYIQGDSKLYPTLTKLIGGAVNVKRIRAHWDEILRLAASIKQGTVTASLMLRKLGSYPRQNGLAVALRECGRIERTLSACLDAECRVAPPRAHWPEQRWGQKLPGPSRVSEAPWANPDRRFENQHYRASSLNLVVAAIILWNTVYLELAI